MYCPNIGQAVDAAATVVANWSKDTEEDDNDDDKEGVFLPYYKLVKQSLIKQQQQQNMGRNYKSA